MEIMANQSETAVNGSGVRSTWDH